MRQSFKSENLEFLLLSVKVFKNELNSAIVCPKTQNKQNICSTIIFLGEIDEDDIAYREELFKEVTQLEKKDKITNQFHFIERATQTKNNDTTETEAQTDPPPMYSQERF